MCACGWQCVCIWEGGGGQKHVHGSWVFKLSIPIYTCGWGRDEAAQEYVLGWRGVQGVEGSTILSFPLTF